MTMEHHIRAIAGSPFLVPKLLLGNPLDRKAPLCIIIWWKYCFDLLLRCPSRAWATTSFPSRSLGTREKILYLNFETDYIMIYSTI